MWYNVEFCTSQTLWSHFTLIIHVLHYLTIVTNQTISGLMEEVTACGSIMKINDCLTQNSSPPSVELHRRLKSNSHKLQWRAARVNVRTLLTQLMLTISILHVTPDLSFKIYNIRCVCVLPWWQWAVRVSVVSVVTESKSQKAKSTFVSEETKNFRRA